MSLTQGDISGAVAVQQRLRKPQPLSLVLTLPCAVVSRGAARVPLALPGGAQRELLPLGLGCIQGVLTHFKLKPMFTVTLSLSHCSVQ